MSATAELPGAGPPDLDVLPSLANEHERVIRLAVEAKVLAGSIHGHERNLASALRELLVALDEALQDYIAHEYLRLGRTEDGVTSAQPLGSGVQHWRPRYWHWVTQLKFLANKPVQTGPWATRVVQALNELILELKQDAVALR